MIIALDLYLKHGMLSSTHPKVAEASAILNDLPIHTTRPDLEKFRNPNAVALKLANFASIDPDHPGAGMSRAGQGDAKVWAELHDKPDLVEDLAEAIRSGAAAAPAAAARPEDNEDEVPEGRVLFRLHRARERNRAIVKKKKESVFAAGGKLACEACGIDFGEMYGDFADGYIECHHRTPLHVSGPTSTTLADLALICANCHRVVHLARPWMAVEDLGKLVESRRPS